MVPRKVGEQLRRRRQQLSMRQQDVAESIGKSRAYVGAVENGVEWDPDIEVLVAWCELLDFDARELLRSLGRSADVAEVIPVTGGLTPGVMAAIRREVAAGIREALDEARTGRLRPPTAPHAPLS